MPSTYSLLFGCRRQSDAAFLDDLEERAQVEMQRIDSQFVGVAHETLIAASPFGLPSRK